MLALDIANLKTIQISPLVWFTHLAFGDIHMIGTSTEAVNERSRTVASELNDWLKVRLP
jgi:hypothetical protein